MKTSDAVQSGNANHEHLSNSQVSSIVEERKNSSNGALVGHLNINSTQNRFEELKLLNDSLKARVLVISETKIDRFISKQSIQSTQISNVSKG